MSKLSAFCFLLLVFFFSPFTQAETYTPGGWRSSASQAMQVENSTIDGDGSFQIKWTNPAVAYDEGFKVYHHSPSDTRYRLLRTTHALSTGFSNLEMGVHRFAIECICFEDEDYGDAVSMWARLTVEIGEAVTITPKYKIMSIVYAPPGTKNNEGENTILYANSSSMGSSTKASETFVRGHEVELKNEFGKDLAAPSLTITASYSGKKSNWSEEVFNIQKEASKELIFPGSEAVNGVNHNDDQIVLWLNPKINVFTTPTASRWMFDENQEMDLLYVFVGHLKNPSTMPGGTADDLAGAGITPDFYSDILAAYPFQYEDEPLDLDRFKYIDTISFQPPYAPGNATNTTTLNFSFNSSSINSSSTTAEKSYSVKIESSFGIMKLWNMKSKSSTEWTWTDVDSRQDTEGTSESARAIIRGPSFGYSGPTSVRVYYDVIYKTFAFIH